MVFSSPVFLFLFLPIVLIGYHGIFRKTASGNLWLLLASILFYAWGEPVYVFVILLSSILNWLISEQIKKHSGKKRKLLFIIVLVLDITVLVISKYTGFLLDNLNLLLQM